MSFPRPKVSGEGVHAAYLVASSRAKNLRRRPPTAARACGAYAPAGALLVPQQSVQARDDGREAKPSFLALLLERACGVVRPARLQLRAARLP